MNQSVFQRKRDGKWFARVVFTDPATGKRVDCTKAARDEAHAQSLLPKLIAESTGLSSELATAPMIDQSQPWTSFKQLAADYSRHKVKPAQYRKPGCQGAACF